MPVIQAHMEEARAPVPREAAPPAAPAAEAAVSPAEPCGAAAPAVEAEADPFNLDAIMEPPAPRCAAAPVLVRLACPIVAKMRCLRLFLGSAAAVSGHACGCFGSGLSWLNLLRNLAWHSL